MLPTQLPHVLLCLSFLPSFFPFLGALSAAHFTTVELCSTFVKPAQSYDQPSQMMIGPSDDQTKSYTFLVPWKESIGDRKWWWWWETLVSKGTWLTKGALGTTSCQDRFEIQPVLHRYQHSIGRLQRWWTLRCPQCGLQIGLGCKSISYDFQKSVQTLEQQNVFENNSRRTLPCQCWRENQASIHTWAL